MSADWHVYLLFAIAALRTSLEGHPSIRLSITQKLSWTRDELSAAPGLATLPFPATLLPLSPSLSLSIINFLWSGAVSADT